MLIQLFFLGAFLFSDGFSPALAASGQTCPPLTLQKGSAIYFQMLFATNSVMYKIMFDRPLAELLGPYAGNSTTSDEASETQNYSADTMAVIICPFGQYPSESLISFCKNGGWTPSFGVCQPMLPKLASKLISLIF